MPFLEEMASLGVNFHGKTGERNEMKLNKTILTILLAGWALLAVAEESAAPPQATEAAPAQPEPLVVVEGTDQQAAAYLIQTAQAMIADIRGIDPDWQGDLGALKEALVAYKEQDYAHSKGQAQTAIAALEQGHNSVCLKAARQILDGLKPRELKGELRGKRKEAEFAWRKSRGDYALRLAKEILEEVSKGGSI